MAKRRQEYDYHWKTAVEKVHLQLDYYLAGGSEAFNADPEINLKNSTYLDTDEEQDSLVQRIVAKTTESQFTVLKLDRDPNDPAGDFYIFLRRQEEGCATDYFQVPLTAFCAKLKIAYENQLTTTAFCFVADASSGKASEILEDLVKEAKTGVAVISEPLWMVNLARLAEAKVYSKAKLETILFALCRLDAWALRDQVQSSHTVMITLPGQGTVATLLPLAQSVFPEDRHIFCYDGCIASVARGERLASCYKRGAIQTKLNDIRSKLAQNPTRHTTPLPTNSPLTKSILRLEDALAQVPISQARVVESWMTSIDAFFKLKDDERSNGYVPYVFKMSFLTNPVGDFEPSTDSYWSLSSLLQFITGESLASKQSWLASLLVSHERCSHITRFAAPFIFSLGSRSRPVSDGVMDAAREFLKDYNRDHHPEPSPILSDLENKAIENCVFQHKSILIGNKTLKDTVLPKQHWTLKQASRAGCSCCGPDPYDEMEENETKAKEGMKVAGVDVSRAGVATLVSTNDKTIKGTTGYVDGKMGFAFDPTKFS
jgi:hypothetical protein